MDTKKFIILFSLTLLWAASITGYHFYRKTTMTKSIAQWEQAIKEREPIFKEYQAIQLELNKYYKEDTSKRERVSSSGSNLIPFWLIVFVLIIIRVLWALLVARPSNCQICGNPLRRSSYTWNTNGQKKQVCPYCNQRLERDQSRNAFR